MSFLSWTTALLAAAIAVPALLLLYFLKLRRQERAVSSTLLWKKAVHDLQVNAPFQRLRKNLLLFLQLLILAAVLFGLANPVANFLKRPHENIILMIDRSASMKAIEADGRTRLEHGKDAAEDFVDGLPDGASAMVISFADRATVERNFTTDKRRLISGIRGIEPTEAGSFIGEALQLAVAYSSQLIEDPRMTTPAAAAVGQAEIELFSDGRIADADRQAVIRGDLHYYRMGHAADNAGIVAFDVRRELERPGILSVFVQIENFGPDPITTDVSISLNGRLLPGSGAIQEVSLGGADAASAAGSADTRGSGGLPSAQNVIFEFTHDAGGVIEVRLHRDDVLAADNVVRAPIDPPRNVRILAVSGRRVFRKILGRALDAVSVGAVDWKTAAEYEDAPDDALAAEGRSRYDIVIFDRHDTNRLPPGNYVFFGGVPQIEGVEAGDMIEDQYIVTWKENHPLLRPAEFDNVYIARWRRLKLPDHATLLVEGEDSAIMAFINEPGHRFVIAAFDLLDSDFALKVPFIIFLQNTIRLLAGAGLQESGRLVAAGDTITVTVPAGAEQVRVRRPGGSSDTIDVRDRHTVTYARTHKTGVYGFRFDDAATTVETYAANILSPTESRVVPNDGLALSGTAIKAVTGEAKVNEPLWPYAVAAALLILLIEWWIYNRRVMI
ncbi:MAG: VWA domain-containing protein [Phycisphaerae bacterium]